MSIEHKQYEDHNILSKVLGFIVFFTVFSATQIAGFSLISLLFQYTGRPSDIIAHIISAFAGILLMFFGVGSVLLISGHERHKNRNEIYILMTDTLAQIAKGNFNVLIEADDGDVHRELADAINDMARNLSNLETMRQDFISNVSHEIQSPLTSIGGFAALMQKEDLPPDQRKKYAGIIETESRRLSSLSDNLLKLTSLDNSRVSLQKRDFRLDKQIENITLTLEPQWTAKNLTIEASLCNCTVCGDEELLSQVWMNLLHNAIKFTPDGGHINIMLLVCNDTVTVKISDTGIGIDPNDQIHIFERFFKADKARDRSLGGNGLGLSLVKKIIEMHGGYVTVESEVGTGTIFEISLYPMY